MNRTIRLIADITSFRWGAFITRSAIPPDRKMPADAMTASASVSQKLVVYSRSDGCVLRLTANTTLSITNDLKV